MHPYERVARVIHYLESHHAAQPDLAALAAQAGLSPFHFHRLFSAWAGVTPKDFLQCLTVAHAKSLLRQGATVLDAALQSGLSGPGRLHDLCVTLEAATPGEWKAAGAGQTLTYGRASSPFGACLIATNARGVCHLAFVDDGGDALALDTLRAEWPRARMRRDDAHAAGIARRVFQQHERPSAAAPLHAYVRGTAFQLKVWRALLLIPPGMLVTYGDLAAALGEPRSARAVGTAVGRNPLAFLIPCHRVIRETGIVGGYRWGATRKRAMLAWESAVRPPAPAGP
jgi:AraC family transcriptional regulator of adaptative response/methylated-DNA-[protein]-cysteine methyltransferase